MKDIRGVEPEGRLHVLNLQSLCCWMDKGYRMLVYHVLDGFLEGVQWRVIPQMEESFRLWSQSPKLKKERMNEDSSTQVKC